MWGARGTKFRYLCYDALGKERLEDHLRQVTKMGVPLPRFIQDWLALLDFVTCMEVQIFFTGRRYLSQSDMETVKWSKDVLLAYTYKWRRQDYLRNARLIEGGYVFVQRKCNNEPGHLGHFVIVQKYQLVEWIAFCSYIWQADKLSNTLLVTTVMLRVEGLLYTVAH